ncbi:hypothetical protein D3C76_394300 [compost metagenome]
MLDVLEVAILGEIGQLASAHLELRRYRLPLIVVLGLDADTHQDRHTNDMQDVVLVALALPVLDVQVGQLQQRWLGCHETSTTGVEGNPWDVGQAVHTFVMDSEFAAFFLPAVDPPCARLQNPNLLYTYRTEFAVLLLHHLAEANHGEHAVLGPPAQHLLRLHHDHIWANACSLFLGLCLHGVGALVVNERMAEAMAHPLAEEADSPGIQVIAGAVDVLGHLDNGLGHIVAHLQRLGEHSGGHVAHGLGVRRQQGRKAQALFVGLVVFGWVLRQQGLARGAHCHCPAHERRDHGPVGAHRVDSGQRDARVIAHGHILRDWVVKTGRSIG